MATQVYPTFVKSAGESGALREYWVKMTGLVGLKLDGGAATIVNTVQNPFAEDMVIWEAFIDVTTITDQNADLDIGLGNDVDGGSSAAEVADGLTGAGSGALGVAGVNELGIAHLITTPPVKPIWKAPLTATTADSWLVFDQNGTVDALTLRYSCLVKLIPYADLV